MSNSPQHQSSLPPVIALVVPCYNEQDVLNLSMPVLLDVLHRMIQKDIASGNSYILCVDDGSRDNTWQLIEHFSAKYPQVRGVGLAHNRGQQFAIIAGLTEVTGKCDAAVTIDADLQDSPDAIIEMVERFREGYDIVYGVRNSRASDTWFKRNSARAFYRFQRYMDVDTIYDHSEFRLMSRHALTLLGEYGESNLFLRGIMPHIGLKSTQVHYDREPRLAGTTKFPLSKLISTGIDGITSFSAKPMRLIFLVGAALLLLDIIIASWVLISHFRGSAISGWSSIMLSVWFLGSLILIALGIIGEYIGKIFVEVKHRPRYAISRRTGQN